MDGAQIYSGDVTYKQTAFAFLLSVYYFNMISVCRNTQVQPVIQLLPQVFQSIMGDFKHYAFLQL